MSRKYYALYNNYGNETSTGFVNTWAALAFPTRRARDEYVERYGSRNLLIRACSRNEAAKHADRDYDGRWVGFVGGDSDVLTMVKI